MKAQRRKTGWLRETKLVGVYRGLLTFAGKISCYRHLTLHGMLHSKVILGVSAEVSTQLIISGFLHAIQYNLGAGCFPLKGIVYKNKPTATCYILCMQTGTQVCAKTCISFTFKWMSRLLHPSFQSARFIGCSYRRKKSSITTIVEAFTYLSGKVKLCEAKECTATDGGGLEQ